MALVAYDYDSNSENEDEEENDNSTVIIPNKINGSETHNEVKPATAVENSIFSTLPETKTAVKDIVEDQIEDFIPKPEPVKKEKQKVKISIPSLSEFADIDDEEPESKKIKPSSKGSGLISILPPVKGTVKTATSFVPKVIANKIKPVPPKPEVKKTVPIKVKQKRKHISSDTESEDDTEMPETFDDEMWEKICGRPKKQTVIQEPESTSQEVPLNIAPEAVKPYDGLDNQAFKELVGKTKRPIGNIKLIDINEEEILPDKDVWMAKSLTDPEMAPKPVIEDPVDPTRRKKHHITYLAQQAKANEQELKNQWAISKNNRFATRSKYGF